MIDKLLDYYQRELAFLRELGGEFAQRFPKIAGRLRMDEDAIEDPHVSRFIEASALLAARTRLKIDDQFPDICQSILQTLYPHYLAPQPPSCIVQLNLKQAAADNPAGYVVKRGATLESESIDGDACRFRTCFETRLWPFSVEQVDYLVAPLPFETSPWNREVQAAIRVRLTAKSDKQSLSELQVKSLRFYLGGSPACSNALIEALFGQVLGVALCDSQQNKTRWLTKDAVVPIGYDEHQSLLPINLRSLSAYRIISEFFVANEKFRFVDVDLGEQWSGVSPHNQVELVFFLERHQPVLQRELDAQALRIGATPIVNLFFKRAEPIRLTSNVTQHRIIPSARKPTHAEVYSVDRVTAVSSSGEEREFLPFFRPDHRSEDAGQRYWSINRQRSLGNTSDEDRGSEVYISVVDLNGEPTNEQGWTLDVETTCLNRDRVSKLPFGTGQPVLRVIEGGASVDVKCVTPPTPTLRPGGRDEWHWRLISHLSLNHLTLIDQQDGAESLREILRLYNPDDRAEPRKIIESLTKVSYSRSVARLPGTPAPGVCRGLDIDILVDEERLGSLSPVLFAHILERFFGLFANINSFTRTTVRTLGGDLPLIAGRPRAGNQSLL